MGVLRRRRGEGHRAPRRPEVGRDRARVVLRRDVLLDKGGLRSATVTADTDMHLLVLSSRSFSSLMDEIPGVAQRVMAGMAERLRAAERAPTH